MYSFDHVCCCCCKLTAMCCKINYCDGPCGSHHAMYGDTCSCNEVRYRLGTVGVCVVGLRCETSEAHCPACWSRRLCDSPQYHLVTTCCTRRTTTSTASLHGLLFACMMPCVDLQGVWSCAPSHHAVATFECVLMALLLRRWCDLCGSASGRVQLSPFIVAIDRPRNAIVVAIRATLSMEDVVTDGLAGTYKLTTIGGTVHAAR